MMRATFITLEIPGTAHSTCDCDESTN
eukprot:COSAG01_NODE_14968_length_1390_cov_2.336174_3_plen_26_part_01